MAWSLEGMKERDRAVPTVPRGSEGARVHALSVLVTQDSLPWLWCVPQDHQEQVLLRLDGEALVAEQLALDVGADRLEVHGSVPGAPASARRLRSILPLLVRGSSSATPMWRGTA